jgi:hypothetical protein
MRLEEKARASLEEEYEVGFSADLRKGVEEEAAIKTKNERILSSGTTMEASHCADILSLPRIGMQYNQVLLKVDAQMKADE